MAQAQPELSPSLHNEPTFTTATETMDSDYEGGDDESLHSTDMHGHCSSSHHHHPSSGSRTRQRAQHSRSPRVVSAVLVGSSSENGAAVASASKHETGRLLEIPKSQLPQPSTSGEPSPVTGLLAPGASTDDEVLDTCHHNNHVHEQGLETHTPDCSCQQAAASFPSRAYDKAEELARRVWEAGWTVVHHQHLPKWLRDNDFLIKGHRPPLHSFLACFKSIFRIHTETGNIWTHLLGFIAFLGVATYFLTRPSEDIQWQEKAVFSAFFAGAILCLGFSTLFHTVYCHSERVGKLFNKLDYCGIALLTMGSFVPWLYYSFYCRLSPKIIYLALILVLGSICIVVSMWDKFASPKFRAVRAGVFIALGLSGVIPAMHYVITDGFYEAVNFAALGWLVLMAVLYITGAVIYAVRIPERIWPGKFDIWFQSHTIFHMFVLAAAMVHFHGVSNIAAYRLSHGDCVE